MRKMRCLTLDAQKSSLQTPPYQTKKGGKLKRSFLSFLLLICVSVVNATTTYYSQSSGDALTLSRWNTVRLGGGTSPLNFTTGDIFVIQNAHSVTTSGTWTVSGTGNKIQIESGGTLTATSIVATTTFQVDNGGTYIHNAISGTANGTATDLPGSTTRTFGASSTVEFQKWATAAGTPVALPTVSWGNLKINVPTFAGSWQQSGGLTTIQGNLIILQTGGFEFRLANAQTVTTTVGGSVTVSGGILNTASGGGTPTLTIAGDLTVNGGTLSAGTSSSAVTVINVNGTAAGSTGTVTISSGTLNNGSTANWTLNVAGNLTMTGGTLSYSASGIAGPVATINVNGTVSGTTGSFAMSGSSQFTQGSSAGLVLTTAGDLTLSGTASMVLTSSAAGSSGRAQVLNIGGNLNIGVGTTFTASSTSSTTSAINFTGGSSSVSFTNSGTTTIAQHDVTVAAGKTLLLNSDFPNTYASTGAITVNGTLNCITNKVTGSTAFTLGSAGTLKIGSAAGITSTGATGSIQSTGTRTFPTTASYEYNGSAASAVTGAGLPATVNNLTINNATGVGLSSALTVSTTLTMSAGVLSIGANNLTLSSAVSGATSAKYIAITGAGRVIKTFSTSSYTFPIGPDATHYAPVTITNTGGTSQTYTVGVASLSGFSPTSDAASWQWSVATAGGTSASTLAFGWSTSDAGASLNAAPGSGLPYQYNGTSWIQKTGSTSTGTPNTTTVTGVTSFTNTLWTVALAPSIASVTLSGISTVGAANIAQNTPDNIIYNFQLAVTTASATLNQVVLPTSGNYTSSDITNLKLWYYSSNNFGLATAIKTIPTPAGATSETFGSLTQAIASGATGFFWVTATVAPGATVGHTITVTPALSFSNLTFSATVTPTTGTINAGGTQTVSAGTTAVTLAGITTVAAGNITSGTTNNIVYNFSLSAASVATTLTQVTLPTTGNYTSSDLTNLKLWYTATNTFNAGTATLLNTIGAVTGISPETFTGFTQSIAIGATGYFWVTADVAGGATAGHTITVTPALSFSNLTFGNPISPTTGTINAGGTQTVISVPAVILNGISTVGAANIAQATTNNIIYNFSLNGANASTNLTQVTLPTTGTYSATDLSNLKLWYTTTNNFASPTLLKTITPAGAGTETFSSLSQAITPGSTGYFWITADVLGGALIGNTITVTPALAQSNFTFSVTPTFTVGTINAGGTQTVSAGTSGVTLDGISTVTAGNIFTGYPNNILYNFKLAVTNVAAVLNQVTLPTTGTYTASDLTNLKLWYANTNSFGAATAISTITPGGAGTETFGSLTQSIGIGATGYFWVTADVAGGATLGNTITVTPAIGFTNLTFAGSTSNTLGAINAGGTKTITVPTSDVTLSGISTIAAGNVFSNTPNNIVYNFKLDVATVNATLTQVTIPTTGAYTSSDITNLKLWYSSSNNFVTATAISTITTVAGAGTETFGSLTQVVTAGATGYFWVTADVSSGATTGDDITVTPALAFSNLTFAGATNNTVGTINAGGTQTIVVVPTITLNGISTVAAASIAQATTNNIIYNFSLNGAGSTATLSQVTVPTSGTYVIADLSNMKLWYNSVNNFGTASAISTISITATGTQTFGSLSQAIGAGATGYFWVTTDVAGAATVGHTLTVTPALAQSNFTFSGGVNFITGTINAGGTQTISAGTSAVTLNGISTIGAANVVVATNNNIIYNFSLNGASVAATLTQVTIPTTGTYTSTDITSLKLWYNSSNSFGTATAIKTITPAGGGTETFSALSQSIGIGATGYFWVTANVGSGATVGRTITVTPALSFSNLTFSGSTTNTVGSINAGGTQTVFLPTYYLTPGATVLTTASNWTDARAGGGTSPADFTGAGTFIIQGSTDASGNPTGQSAQTVSVGAWTLNTNAKLEIEGSAQLTATGLISSLGTFTVDNLGTYIHNTIGSGAAGSSTDFPGTTGTGRVFGATSTVEIRAWGVASQNPPALPTIASPGWGNLILNYSTAVSGSLQMSGALTAIQGNLNVQATGGFEFRLSASTSPTINITGNVTVSGGTLTATTTGSPIISIGGDLVISGGTLNAGTSAGTNTTINVTGTKAGTTGSVTISSGSLLQGSTAFWTLNVAGDMSMSSTGAVNFSASGSSSTVATINVNGTHAGTTGAFSMTGSSTVTQGSSSGVSFTTAGNFSLSGTSSFSLTSSAAGSSGRAQILNIGGNLSIGTGCSFTASSTSSSTSQLNFTGGSATATFSNSGTVTIAENSMTIAAGKTLTLNNDLTTNIAQAGNFTVNGTLVCNPGKVTGTNNFILGASGTLKNGDAAGITTSGATGSIQTSGATRTFPTTASYEYVGSASSAVTGAGLPATVGNLTINNTNGVTLTSAVTVANTGTLALTAGKLSLGNNNLTLGTSALSGGSASSYASITGTGKVLRTFSTSGYVFPIGISTGYAPVTITNTGGTSQNYTASVAATTYTPSTAGVNYQWAVTSGGGSASTLAFGWFTANAGAALSASPGSGKPFLNTGGSTWAQQTGSTATGTPNVTTVSGVTFTSSVYTVAHPGDITLNSISTVAAGNIQQGSSNNIIYNFSLNGSGSTSTVTQVTLPTTGTYTASDITSLKLYYTTSSTFNTSTLLKTITPGGAGTETFGSISQAITAGSTGYFWVTAQVAPGATIGNTITVTPALAQSNFTFSNAPNFTVGSISAGGTQTVIVGTPSVTLSGINTISAGSIAVGSTNSMIYNFQLDVTNATATLTQVTVPTSGSYTVSDLTNMKLWYSSSNNFVAATAISTITPGGPSLETFSGFSQAIAYNSTGYFWITADVAGGATVGNDITVTPALSFSNLTFSTTTANTTGSISAGGTQTISAVPAVTLDEISTIGAASIAQATTNNVFYNFQLAVSAAPVTVSQVNLPTSGTYTTGDLTNLKLWYNTVNDFSTAIAIKTITAAGATTEIFGGLSQSIGIGVTGYFWVTGDVAGGATVGHTLTVTPALAQSNITFSTTVNFTTGTINAGGTQTISAGTSLVTLNGISTIAAANITHGSTNNIIYNFSLNDGSVPATLTQVTIPTTGSYTSSDLTNLKLWYNSTNSFATATSIKTITPGGAGTETFGSLSQTIGIGATGYFWITADASSSATQSRTITVTPAIDFTNLTFAGTTSNTVGTINAGGTQTIFTSSNVTDDFRSAGSGDWATVGTWQSAVAGSGNWHTATATPTSSATSVAVRSTHAVSITSAVTVGNMTIDGEVDLKTGGSITVASGKTATVNNLFDNQQNTVSFTVGTGAMSIAAGGTYKSSGYTGNALLLFTGVTFASGASGGTLYLSGTGSPRLPASNPGNVIWNAGSNTFLNATTTSIGGNLTVMSGTINNGSGGAARTLNLSGNLIIQGGEYDLTGGSATASTGQVTNVTGDVTVSGGVLAVVNNANSGTNTGTLSITGNVTISGGSLYTVGSASGAASTATLNITGNLVHTAGNFGNASSTPTTPGNITFNGTSAQSISTIGLTNTGKNNVIISNASGVTLNTDLTINGSLTLTSGTLGIGAHSLYLGGAVTRTSGSIDATSGTVEFNGTTAQSPVAGTLSGTNILNLSINNSAGVTLSANRTVTGTLYLKAGALTMSATTLTISNGASINRTAGTLAAAPAWGGTADVTYSNSTNVTIGNEMPILPGSASVLNNLSTIGVGNVTMNRDVTVNGALSLGGGVFGVGSNTLTLKGSVSATSGSLTCSTSGSLGTINYAAAGAQIALQMDYGNLIFSGSGTKTIGSGITNITGTFTDGGLADATTNSTTIIFSGAQAQTVPGISYYNLTTSNSSKTLAATATVTGNITISGGSSLDASAGDLSVGGDWTNAGTFTPGSKKVTLNGTADQVINITGTGGFNDLTLNKASGNVSTTSSLTIPGTFTLTSGKMILGSFDLTAAAISGGSSSSYVVENSSGKLTRTSLNGSQLMPLGVSTSSYSPVTITNTTSKDWSVQLSSSIPTAGTWQYNRDRAIQRMWEVTPSAAPGATDLSFTYNTADAGIQGASYDVNAAVIINHLNSSTGLWEQAGSQQSQSAGINTIVVSGWSSFSPFVIGMGAAPLPVTFLNFTGKKDGSTNKLAWTTATEINNSGFDVERSADGVHYTSIGFVASKASNGNSTMDISYTFNDTRAGNSKQYYRLRQVDLDNRSKYSQVVMISGTKISVLSLSVMYPNPVKSSLNLVLDAPASSMVKLVVTDANGRTVKEKSITTTEGSNSASVNLTELAAGNYYIRATAADGSMSEAQKVVKQ